jgi:hypothetical protein
MPNERPIELNLKLRQVINCHAYYAEQIVL